MEADTQAHVAFFLTGRRPSEYLDAVEGLGLRPALFAGYRELTQLRYDFPLLLVANRSDAGFAQSLSGLVDAALGDCARGSDAERIRKHALRMEQEVRVLVSGGATGPLSALWDKAAGRLARGTDKSDADKSLADSLRRTRAAIKVDRTASRSGGNSMMPRAASAANDRMSCTPPRPRSDRVTRIDRASRVSANRCSTTSRKVEGSNCAASSDPAENDV